MIDRTKLFSVPVRCYWDECPVVWHDHVVYRAGEDYIFVEYAEGSPRNLTAAEVESLRESLPARWREYAEYVIANGRDPLGMFWVRRVMTPDGLKEAAAEALANGWCGEQLGEWRTEGSLA